MAVQWFHIKGTFLSLLAKFLIRFLSELKELARKGIHTYISTSFLDQYRFVAFSKTEVRLKWRHSSS